MHARKKWQDGGTVELTLVLFDISFLPNYTGSTIIILIFAKRCSGVYVAGVYRWILP